MVGWLALLTCLGRYFTGIIDAAKLDCVLLGELRFQEELANKISASGHFRMEKLLSKNQIVEALEVLARELPVLKVPHEIVVVGGAALVLLYGARESTRDLDALVSDRSVIEAAERVADELGLPRDWLNDGVKGYITHLTEGPELFRTTNLLVRTVAPHQLLAMKLCAWRDDVDIEDARLILSHLQGDRADIWGRVSEHLSRGDELKAKYAFLDLWESERCG